MQLYAPPAVVLLCVVNGSGTRILCGSLTLTILAPLPASIFSKFVGENNASTAIGRARSVPPRWILLGPKVGFNKMECALLARRTDRLDARN